MTFTPTGLIYLLDVPIESDNKNQLTFSDSAAQSAYFLSRQKRTFSDFTYMRKDNIIRVPVNVEDLYNINYVMYQNRNFGSKWFYAFIEQLEYINPNCTHLHIKTDVFQTWQFNITYYNSFVVREHVADDRPFTHTLPENIASGDVAIYREDRATPYNFSGKTVTDFNNNYMCAVCSSIDLVGGTSAPSIVGGVATACYFYATSLNNIRDFLNYFVSQGWEDSIIAVYPILKNAVILTSHGIIGIDDIYTFTDSQVDTYLNFNISRTNMLSGATVKNKKCLNYPYNYLTLHNSNGSSVDLKIEDFFNVRESYQDFITLHTYYNPACDVSLCVAPKFYKFNGTGDSDLNSIDFSYSVEYNNFPQISYNTGVYESYLGRHASTLSMEKLNLGVNAARNIINTAETGNAGGLITSAMSIGSYYAKMADLERQPDKVHGIPSGGAEFVSKSAGVRLAYKSIYGEYLNYVDNYFSMFGYNVSTIKNPHDSMFTRPNWNYVETRNINISGDIPDEDTRELKNMFNSGVTLWHNPSTFGDYTQANAPI